MTNKIKQHYVPQFYLRKFAQNGGKLYVYDKSARTAFAAAINNIAEERYFYNLPEELITEEMKAKGVSRQSVEDALAKFEGLFSETLDRFCDRPKKRPLDGELRHDMAMFMVMQMTRTKEARKLFIEGETKLRRLLLEEYAKKHFPNVPPDMYPTITLAEAHESIVHARYIFNIDLWEEVATRLSRQIWMVAANRTTAPLYTSDHPIIKQIMTNKPTGPTNTFSGVRLFIPIMPNEGIIVYDREHYAGLGSFDGKVRVLSEQEVNEFNRQQVIQSYRQIYSINEDFTLAERACAELPELCSLEVERVKISEFSQNEDGKTFIIRSDKAQKNT